MSNKTAATKKAAAATKKAKGVNKATATKPEGATTGAKIQKLKSQEGSKNAKETRAAGLKTGSDKAVKSGKAAPAEKTSRAGTRGADRPYKVLSKDQPFREGTIRADFWNLIKGAKTTGEVRAQDSRCTTSFFDELEARELIKYTD